MSEQEPNDIPTDFGPEILLDEDKLENFLELFNVKIIYEEEKLVEIEDMKKKTQENLALLKNKFKILDNYKKFQDSKGFSVVNQHLESHMKEIQATETARVTDNPLCMIKYEFYGNFATCFKNKNHLGSCGPGC